MTIQPQPPRPNAEYTYRPVAPIVPQVNFEPPMKQAPTLRQFWRSDARRDARAVEAALGGRALVLAGSRGRRPADRRDRAFEIPNAADIALGIGAVAGFFGLVALIAGIGRVSGFFGIILALVGNVFVLSWLGENVF